MLDDCEIVDDVYSLSLSMSCVIAASTLGISQFWFLPAKWS